MYKNKVIMGVTILIAISISVFILRQNLNYNKTNRNQSNNSLDNKRVTANTPKEQIMISQEIGINYVVHLYTLAQAGFKDEEYTKHYSDTVNKGDREFLIEHKEMMSFYGINKGVLTYYLFFIPALNNFQTTIEWENYFKSVNLFLETKEDIYIEAYLKEAIVPIDTLNNKISQDVFYKFQKIFINNFDTYKTQVWPFIQKELSVKSNELNQMIGEFNYIDRWEEVTNYEYNYNNYLYVLYYAGENGPSHNNLSLWKNSCYYQFASSKDMLDMFSHELGMHLILPEVIDLWEQHNTYDVSDEIVYQSLETLVTFLNEKVLDRAGYDMNILYESDFYTIYNELYLDGITSPRDLYEEGFKIYLKRIENH